MQDASSQYRFVLVHTLLPAAPNFVEPFLRYHESCSMPPLSRFQIQVLSPGLGRNPESSLSHQCKEKGNHHKRLGSRHRDVTDANDHSKEDKPVVAKMVIRISNGNVENNTLPKFEKVS